MINRKAVSEGVSGKKGDGGLRNLYICSCYPTQLPIN